MTMLLHHMIDRAASRNSDAEAIRCGNDSLRYGDLVVRAGGLARLLRAAGVESQDRVAVLLGKGLDVPVAFYGVLAAGGAIVPIDPQAPAAHAGRILRATGARHWVTEPKRAAFVREVLAQAPDVTHVIGLDTDVSSEPGATRTYHPWSAIDSVSTGDLPDVRVLDSDTAYVLHTSGSTGAPKLIRHTHATAMSFVDWAATEYRLRSEDRLSNHASHHTCFATFDYYAAARVGACTVVLTPAALKMPASLAALLERERVSVWYSVPTALVQLSLRGALETRDLSALRWILFAGETFPEKHLRRIREQLGSARFSHVYGSTEVNVVTYYHLPDGPAAASASLPIGRACANTVTEVVDDQDRPVPDGGEGELLIRGGTVMSGYWDDAARNDQVFVRRPTGGGFEDVYFRTGDHVRRLDDGNLTFVARADFQVKVRGYRVELGEVESALLAIDGVEEAAAFAVPDAQGSSALRAVAVLGSEIDSGIDLVAALRQRLPVYAVPERVDVLPSMPRTPTGKVDRKALRVATEEIGTEPPANQTTVETSRA